MRFYAFHISSELRLHCGFLRQETNQNKYVVHSSLEDGRRGLLSQGRNRDANRPPSPISIGEDAEEPLVNATVV
jgi:hypothetical protein